MNPFQTVLGGNVSGSAFVSKLSTDGSTLLFSSYLGGKKFLRFAKVVPSAIDPKDKSAYVAGFTTSTIFPTVAPLQVALGRYAKRIRRKVHHCGCHRLLHLSRRQRY